MITIILYDIVRLACTGDEEMKHQYPYTAHRNKINRFVTHTKVIVMNSLGLKIINLYFSVKNYSTSSMLPARYM